MNSAMKAALAVVSIVAALSGCAGQDTAPGAMDSTERVCVNIRMINSFNPLSEREVFVTASVNDHYLFTVMGICQGLEYATRLGVGDTTGSICNDGFGRIVFRDMSLGRQSCRVQDIERVVDVEEAEKIVEAREQARRGHDGS